MNFKAAILTEINKPLVLETIGTTTLKVGQVLVKNIVSGLCGAQLQEIAGLKGNSKFLPHLLGHEGCGIVQEIGPGVTIVKPDDKVVMHWMKGGGIESEYPQYIYKGKLISSGKVTTLSEYSIVSENRLTKVDKTTYPELCALLGCGLTTALGIINNEANLKLGESILVVGCGGVGLGIIHAAQMVNGFPIYGIDENKSKEKIVKILGGTKFYHTSDENIDSLNGKMDVIVDTTGNIDIISKTFPFLANSGRYILVSQPKPDKSIIIPNAYKLFDGTGKTIKATQGGRSSPNEDIRRYVKLHNAGLLNIEKIITHSFKLDDINSAIDLLRTGSAGRIIINI